MGNERTPIRGKGWTRKSSISSAKFESVSRAILASLTSTPITFTQLVERVDARLRDFDGSVAWYTITRAQASLSSLRESRGPPGADAAPGRCAREAAWHC